MVLEVGLEPTRLRHMILSHARLPIPPRQHIGDEGRIRTYEVPQDSLV